MDNKKIVSNVCDVIISKHFWKNNIELIWEEEKRYESEKNTKFTRIYNLLDMSKLGIFSTALRKCSIKMVVIIKDINPEELVQNKIWEVYVELSYQHIGYGSNGCDTDMGFKFRACKCFRDDEVDVRIIK